MLKESKDELIKDFYSLFSSYDEKGISKYDKKGSEIKSGLSSLLSEINKKKSEKIDAINSALDKFEFAPNKGCDEYNEYYYLLDFIPKKFDWNLLYNGESYINKDNGIEQSAVKVPTEAQRQEMREYNENVYSYLTLCVDKIKLEAMKRNIQDNKSYSLSLDQVALLGL